MAQKKVLIIGAGMAGLAAGCYAQMNGYAAEIFELHELPGGLCTSWERKGYTIDGCIHGRRLYDTEQLQVADQVLAFLEERYPGLPGAVEVKDVATPLSYERYTGNWQGATCGWLLTEKTMMMMIRGLKKTVPGLRNLYLAGQWVEPGGSVPIVATSGRNAVQLLCAADGRPFAGVTAPADKASAPRSA